MLYESEHFSGLLPSTPKFHCHYGFLRLNFLQSPQNSLSSRLEVCCLKNSRQSSSHPISTERVIRGEMQTVQPIFQKCLLNKLQVRFILWIKGIVLIFNLLGEIALNFHSTIPFVNMIIKACLGRNDGTSSCKLEIDKLRQQCIQKDLDAIQIRLVGFSHPHVWIPLKPTW